MRIEWTKRKKICLMETVLFNETPNPMCNECPGYSHTVVCVSDKDGDNNLLIENSRYGKGIVIDLIRCCRKFLIYKENFKRFLKLQSEDSSRRVIVLWMSLRYVSDTEGKLSFVTCTILCVLTLERSYLEVKYEEWNVKNRIERSRQSFPSALTTTGLMQNWYTFRRLGYIEQTHIIRLCKSSTWRKLFYFRQVTLRIQYNY